MRSAALSYPDNSLAATIARLRDRVEELEEENRQLREQLSPRVSLSNSIGVRLTQVEENILNMLIARSPNIVTHEVLSEYSRDGVTPRVEELASCNQAKVYVCKIRKKIAPIGVEIATHWGQGFSLDKANAAKLRALIAERSA